MRVSNSFWIRADVQDSFVMGKNDRATGQSWGIQCENTPGDGLGVRLDLGDDRRGTPNLATTGQLVFGGWHHVCMEVNREEQTATVFLDATLQRSLDISQIGNIANSVSLSMGKRVDGWNKFRGQLDEVRIYNRALMASEIADLYQAAQ